MKTSWTDTQQIETYLTRRAPPEDLLVWEARLLVDAPLREQTRWQQRTYALVRAYGRQQLRAEIEAAHRHLFEAPAHASFRKKILQLFSIR